MYNKTLIIDTAKPNFPIDPLWAGQSSDCQIDIVGIPAGYSALFIFTHALAGSQPLAIACEEFSADAMYRRIKINGNNFPTVEQMEYEIVAYIVEDGVTTKFSCGKGFLNIYASNTTGTAPIPPSSTVPINLVYNLTDGKIYRQFAQTNELGEVTLVIDPTPVT